MELIGIVIVIIGFVLKFDTIAVVLTAGIVTGLVADMGILDILGTIGDTFIKQRHMALYLLILPIIGISERYGLKQRAIELIKSIKNMSTGKILSLYLLIREIAIAMGLRLGGHAEFVRPLIEPMANGAAVSQYKELDEEIEEKIKAASAAADNYGNFFAQNIFMANSGVLLIAGTLEELGYTSDTLQIAQIAIPVAIITLVLGVIQNMHLDRSIRKLIEKKRGIK
ncbi:MAG: DUF969 domain-containing protein [Niameybacter sp.]|uniref:DUF969 domain-containing protein n=1 Tax=Niameybacter sp. TaxID=2033640 RepID=UPI002FC69ABE